MNRRNQLNRTTTTGLKDPQNPTMKHLAMSKSSIVQKDPNKAWTWNLLFIETQHSNNVLMSPISSMTEHNLNNIEY